MEPRSKIRIFFVLAAVTGLPFGALMALWMYVLQALSGYGWIPRLQTVLPFLGSGTVFGVLFSAAMTPLVRDDTLTLPFAQRDRFLTRLADALQRVGYRPSFLGDSFVIVHPGAKAGFLSGPIRITMNDGEARLIGPWMNLRKVRKLIEVPPG